MLSDDETSTKVYYFLDGNTPFVSTVEVPPDKITLGDFKKVFQKQNFKYFCKEFDPDLKREVKVELSSDSQKLHKSQNGLIQLVLLPIYQTNGQNNGGTLPRTLKTSKEMQGSLKLKKRASAQALSAITDETTDFGMHRVSLATDPSAMTFFSRRAGEHLADVYSSDDDDGGDDEDDDDKILAGSNESSNPTDSPKRGRRNREHKSYVPSTISSATHSSSHSASLPRLDEIKISMKNASCLGIQVVDHDGGIFVSNIKVGSAADQCGLLEIGDQIIQVNNVSFEYLSINQAIAELQKVARSKRTVKMFVAKRPIIDRKSDGLSILCETMPLDVSNWVEATAQPQAAEPMKPFKDLDGPNNNFIDDGGITSDEERAAYIDRRNGVGACLVPALHNFRNNNCFDQPMPTNTNPISLPLPPVAATTTAMRKEDEENEFLHISLTIETDPLIILRRMVHPKSGLIITDRKWLKIPFPNSFIGNEMIDWLLQNVSGFKNKKHAVTYANMLLNRGWVRHVLNGKFFDKKRYYFFEDSIIAYRKQVEQQLQRQHAAFKQPVASTTTEVTYLGSPTYLPHNHQHQQQQPKQKQQQQQSNNLKSMPASCGMLPGSSHHQFIATQNSYLTGSRIPTNTAAISNRATQSQPRLHSTSIRSPFYPPPPNQPSPCAPPLSNNWQPLSPIVHNREQQQHLHEHHRRSCDSPQTNDYASMIQGEINSNYMSVPSNTPNTLSANSSTALLPIIPKFLR